MFYKLVSARYANIRTFHPETGTGTGATGEGDQKADEASEAAAAAAAASAGAEAGSGDAGEASSSVADAPKTDAEKAALLREVMDKKSKLKEAEEKLRGFEGVDLTKYRELLAKEENAARQEAEAKGDFERVKQMMADAHKTDKQTLEQTIADLQAKLADRDNAISELTIGNDFGSSPYIANEMILSPAKTRALYGSYFEIENGKTVGYNAPRGAANRTKLVDSVGAVMPFNDALAKIISADPDKNSILRAKEQPGAGSGTTQTSGAKKTTAASKLYGSSRILASLGKG